MYWDAHKYNKQPLDFLLDLVFYFKTIDILEEQESKITSSTINLELMARQYGHTRLRG